MESQSPASGAPAVRMPEPSEHPWIRISDGSRHVGQTVELRGWVVHRRSSGKIQFLVVRDGSGVMQCVAGVADVSPEHWATGDQLTQESSVVVRGELRADRRAPGGVEMGLREIHLVASAEPYPISPKEHGTDFLMDHRHLWLRSARQQSILRIRAEVIRSFRDFMEAEG